MQNKPIITLTKHNIVDVINDKIKNDKSFVVPHVANCVHVMGAGVALALKTAFPEVYEADLTTVKTYNKLGSISMGKFATSSDAYFVNMYAQYHYKHANDCIPEGYIHTFPLRYDALYSAMTRVHTMFSSNRYELVFPMFGAGLSGGNWNIIEAMINELWPEYRKTLVVL